MFLPSLRPPPREPTVNQAERTRRSRARILEAALELFSKYGFRGTSVREIADEAGVSTGSVYHQFPDKESLFHALLDRYWEEVRDPAHPLNQALTRGHFPDNLEALGLASRESVERFRRYIKLIYVDVVEFEGRHVRKFYASIADRFGTFVENHPEMLVGRERLRPDLDPGFAVMLVSRFFLQYFAVEILFGVENHFGRPSDDVVRDVAEILKRGMLAPEPSGDGAGEGVDDGAGTEETS